MRERFNGFRQVVSQRKIVIDVPLLATTIAEAPHAWGAAGGALERWFYSHSVVASVVEQCLKIHGNLAGIVLKGQASASAHCRRDKHRPETRRPGAQSPKQTTP